MSRSSQHFPWSIARADVRFCFKKVKVKARGEELFLSGKYFGCQKTNFHVSDFQLSYLSKTILWHILRPEKTVYPINHISGHESSRAGETDQGKEKCLKGDLVTPETSWTHKHFCFAFTQPYWNAIKANSSCTTNKSVALLHRLVDQRSEQSLQDIAIWLDIGLKQSLNSPTQKIAFAATRLFNENSISVFVD